MKDNTIPSNPHSNNKQPKPINGPIREALDPMQRSPAQSLQESFLHTNGSTNTQHNIEMTKTDHIPRIMNKGPTLITNGDPKLGLLSSLFLQKGCKT